MTQRARPPKRPNTNGAEAPRGTVLVSGPDASGTAIADNIFAGWVALRTKRGEPDVSRETFDRELEAHLEAERWAQKMRARSDEES